MNISRLKQHMEIIAASFRNDTRPLIHNACKTEFSGVKGGGVAYITEITVFSLDEKPNTMATCTCN